MPDAPIHSHVDGVAPTLVDELWIGSVLQHVVGVVHASEKSWKGIRGPNVTITKTERMTQWPSEDGAFKFSPNPYTRKQ